MEINNKREKNGIKRDMEELRDVLNQICVIGEGEEITSKKRLILSQQLDELIVAYMNKDDI